MRVYGEIHVQKQMQAEKRLTIVLFFNRCFNRSGILARYHFNLQASSVLT